MAAAERRLEEAQAHLTDLERRLRSGEAGISAADLAAATAEVHHAELALQGARTVVSS